MPVAPLNYTSQKGYYGLEVRPTLEGVMGTIRNPLRIPIPSRAAKWYANSPWRALILDAEKANNDYEHARIDYRDSGAELPEAAARVRPSDAGEDPQWDELGHHHGRMDAQEAYEHAFDMANAADQWHADRMRYEHHRLTHGPNRMHPMISAHHGQLEEAGVRHNMPAHRMEPPHGRYRAPPQTWDAHGHPHHPEFHTFEQLNRPDQHLMRRVTAALDRQGVSYDRQPTSYEGYRRSSSTR
jgi:hypothetical protein